MSEFVPYVFYLPLLSDSDDLYGLLETLRINPAIAYFEGSFAEKTVKVWLKEADPDKRKHERKKILQPMNRFMPRFTIYLPGMSCGSCSGIVESLLQDLEGVQDSYTNTRGKVEDRKVTIYLTDLNDEKKVELLSLLEMFMIPDENQKDAASEPIPPTWADSIRTFFSSHWLRGFVGISFGTLFMIMPILFTTLPLAALIAMGVVSIGLTIWIGAKSFQDAYEVWNKTGKFTMDSLFAISTTVTLVVSIAAFFFPLMHMMWGEPLLIFGFRHIGLAVKELIQVKLDLNKKFADSLPKIVRVKNEAGEFQNCLLSQVTKDEELLVTEGEIIPVDGICLSSCLVYTTIQDGSPLPHTLRAGDKLISGMVLAKGSQPLRMKSTATKDTSFLAQLDSHIEDAHKLKAPIEETADKILDYFVRGVLAVGVIAGVIVSIGFSPLMGLQCAIAIFVSACPCILGLLVSLTFHIGMQKAAKNGIHFKSEQELERASDVTDIVFDYHNTLTQGIYSVVDLKINKELIDYNTFLATVSALEAHSAHPIATALVDYGAKKNIAPVPAQKVKAEVCDRGVCAMIDGSEWIIGNRVMLEIQGIKCPPPPKLNDDETIVYLVRDKQILGHIVLCDPLREDAPEAIKLLQDNGYTIWINSGGTPPAACAKSLNIPLENIMSSRVAVNREGEANKTKTDLHDALKAQGKTPAHVGDAANDVTSYVNCFGVNIISDDKENPLDEITRQHAGANVKSKSLLPIVNTFLIARQTVNNITQSLIFNFIYNAVVVALAGGMLLSPGAGAFCMVVQLCLMLAKVVYFKYQAVATIHKGNEQAIMPDEEPDSDYSFNDPFSYLRQNQSNYKPNDNSVNPENFPSPLKSTVNLERCGEPIPINVLYPPSPSVSSC